MARNTRKSPGAWGTVEQLPSGNYRAFYRHEGIKFTAPHSFTTKDDAQAWLAMERADRRRGTWHDPRLGKVTLADYAAAWLDARPDLAPRTREHYRGMLERWLIPRVGVGRGIELGRLHLSELTPSVMRTWYAAVVASARERAGAKLSRRLEAREHPARAWARARGLEVASTGQLPRAVQAAWQAAGSPRPAPMILPAPAEAGRSSAAQAYRLLHTILTTAVTDGLLVANPCQLKGAGVVHHRERGTASPAEVAQLAALVPPHLSAAVTLAAWSGLRWGELFALARRHVDLEAGTVRVERQLLRKPVPGAGMFAPPKTTKSRRTVHLPAFVVARLAEHLAEHVPEDPDALVFATTSGSPWDNANVSRAMRRACAVIDRPDLTWHDLRHTGATLAYRAGASVPEVQGRLGHTTMRAAMIYAHTADDSDRVLAERLNALYSADANGAPRLRAV